jgi:hypothetical protein
MMMMVAQWSSSLLLKGASAVLRESCELLPPSTCGRAAAMADP